MKNESKMMFLLEKEKKDIQVYLLFLSYSYRILYSCINHTVNLICVKINWNIKSVSTYVLLFSDKTHGKSMSLNEQIRKAQERKRLAEQRAALEEEHLASLQRAKLLEDKLAALGQGGSSSGEKSKEGEDSDIECLGEHAKEINYHGTNSEWHPLQKKLIR